MILIAIAVTVLIVAIFVSSTVELYKATRK